MGRHFQQVIKKLGIEDQVLKKSILASDGVETMKLVLAKKVEIGIAQMSEVIQADRSALVGPFPPEYELATRYSLYCKNRDQDKLASFIGLLQSPFGNQVFRSSGLRPVQ
ncbi:molybdate ABC transporter substrate-binding protein [Polynucleobacter necessarius]|uniref:molybdate ABC transporter substrate-binding protein n=1 Tax=Polynucleobacter necessarius TaxID=576610 RepID=UPI0013B04F78|nr:substrate-binding domain-containing protein [Polynucleobacter necessarius]